MGNTEKVNFGSWKDLLVIQGWAR